MELPATRRKPVGRREASNHKENVMKKQIRKISLNRETLQAMTTASLNGVAAGAATLPPVCENSGNAINGCSRRC